jgi:hypothetical protein
MRLSRSVARLRVELLAEAVTTAVTLYAVQCKILEKSETDRANTDEVVNAEVVDSVDQREEQCLLRK